MYTFHINLPFFSNIDVKLYFHGPDQFLDLSGRMGYKLYRGETMESQLMVRDIKLLEKDLHQDKDDTNINEGSKTCSTEIYDDCIYEMLARVMLDNTADKCTVPYIRDDSNICSNPSDINTTFWIAWTRVTNQQKDCNIPCHAAMVSLGAKNYQNQTMDKQNYALLYLYYAPSVSQSTEHFLYTSTVLFAEIGGYVGLLLGFSFFELATWISRTMDTKVKWMEKQHKIK